MTGFFFWCHLLAGLAISRNRSSGRQGAGGEEDEEETTSGEDEDKKD